MPICGSRLRRKPGKYCRQRAMPNGRCRLHGGLAGHHVRTAEYRGIRGPGGWPKGRPRTKKGLLLLMTKTAEKLHPIPLDKTLDECTTGELLSHVGRLALLRAAELMAPAIGDHLDTREMRRVEVGGNIGIKTMARVQVALMQAQAGERQLIEYEAAVARQEKLLGLYSPPKDLKPQAKEKGPQRGA